MIMQHWWNDGFLGKQNSLERNLLNVTFSTTNAT